VLERRGEAIRFHPTLLDLSAHYRFEPRPVAPARGNEKGRVERAIRYIRGAFFAGRTWTDLDDLNAQAAAWCAGPSAQRPCPEDSSRTVADVFADERAHLIALPDNPYPTAEQVDVSIGKTPYARFDGNDYSVPHTQVRRTLTVAACLTRVRLLDGETVIATHARTFDQGRQIEDPAHIADLVAAKRAARTHRGLDRLAQAVPASQDLLRQAAERGTPLTRATAHLVDLLDAYGAAELGMPAKPTPSSPSSTSYAMPCGLPMATTSSRCGRPPMPLTCTTARSRWRLTTNWTSSQCPPSPSGVPRLRARRLSPVRGK
jgi:hypothetical protein